MGIFLDIYSLRHVRAESLKNPAIIKEVWRRRLQRGVGQRPMTLKNAAHYRQRGSRTSADQTSVNSGIPLAYGAI